MQRRNSDSGHSGLGAGGAVIVAAVLVVWPDIALPQATPLNESSRGVIGSWEFSNADRERKCTLTFKDERAGANFRLEFEPQCGDLFPFTKDIIAWSYPDNDLLRLLDAKGKSLVEFSEVESGIFEAPTAGQGVLFLQNAAAAGPPPLPPDKFVGDWTIMRGGKALCVLSLTVNAAEEGFALSVKPGCDPTVALLNFSSWRIDRDELMFKPARGNPWRFEDIGNGTWGRVPEAPNPYTLVQVHQ